MACRRIPVLLPKGGMCSAVTDVLTVQVSRRARLQGVDRMRLKAVGLPRIQYRGIRAASLAASLRVFQWVAPSGFICVVMRTIFAALIVGLRPLRGKSISIAVTLPLPNLMHHAIT